MSASEGESQGLSANISAKNTSILCDPSLTKHPHMLSKKWFFTTDNSSVKLLFARKKYIGLDLFIFFNIHLFTVGYIFSWITWGITRSSGGHKARGGEGERPFLFFVAYPINLKYHYDQFMLQMSCLTLTHLHCRLTWNGHVYRFIKSCHFIWSLKDCW